MKDLQEILKSEPDLNSFLQKKDYFNQKYNGNTDEYLIITDPATAEHYFHLDADYGNWSFIQNSNWEDFTEPPTPEFMSEVLDFVSAHILAKDKKFHDAELVLENLQDNIISDICVLLEFKNIGISLPSIWESIKHVYLHNGWPCGWDGAYPEGKMVVFSNDRNLD